MKRVIPIVLAIFISNTAFATYNANMFGEVAEVLTYTDGDSILIRLKNQPSSHPACNAAYFSIDASVPLERRKAILARLLTAYASSETVNIGYDNAGSCADGYIRVHRVG